MAVRTENVDFVDEKERALFATVILSDDVRDFLKNTSVGKYLHGRAKSTIEQCEVDALNVDPDGFRGWFFGRRKLRQIRLRADAARLFLSWMSDAILEGARAETELNEYRRPD